MRYRDTLDRRIREVGLPELAQTIPRELGDSDDEYVGRVIDFIDNRIGGFSISHVSGRFRTKAILARQQAAEHVARDEPYLIDETTAVVRFIIPCLSSKVVHGSEFGPKGQKSAGDPDIGAEVQQIRKVFFELFVEALVPSIRGEQLIWMVETAPTGQRLYELALVRPPHGGHTKASSDMEDEDEDADSD